MSLMKKLKRGIMRMNEVWNNKDELRREVYEWLNVYNITQKHRKPTGQEMRAKVLLKELLSEYLID